MVVFKIAPLFLLALVVAAEKKIELQDIEEDNLKSEREKEPDSYQAISNSGPVIQSLDLLKSGLFRYYNPTSPHQSPQPTRLVHQYSVTEQPESPPPSLAHHKPYFTHSAPQQAKIAYLLNTPMQLFLVPQYYPEGSDSSDSNTNGHVASGTQYSSAPSAAVAHVAGYSTAPEAVQSQGNYIEVPAYVGPTHHFQNHPQPIASHQVAYVGYQAQPTVTPVVQPTIAPVVAYQVPSVHYQSTAVVAPQPPPKTYHQSPQHYIETNALEEVQTTVDENPKHYSQSEISYSKGPANEYPRYYTPRPPSREESRYSQIQELPHPSALLLKAPPPHLAHIPKALPMYRPLNKSVYGPSNHVPGPLIRQGEPFGVSGFKRRPASLLDSYVPSILQVEYMKRGYTNDPLVAYEALSSGRHFSHPPHPRHFERGFLPNQMYHTAAGGVAFGHFKRASKVDKSSHPK